MEKHKYIRPLVFLACMTSLLLLPSIKVFAQQSSSPGYSVNEYYFGTGGETDLNSAGYKARGAAGSLGVGNSSSASYAAQAGFVTPREEYLEMFVNAATIDLGTLTTASAGTGTATFYVRAYTSSGYTVQTISGTPANGAKTLNAMSVAAASSPGTEQFGINLVANTSPISFGANPVLSPDSSFAYGTAATGYGTTNQFKYNIGDTIATSPKGIGQTNYTISYIANISPVSPGGVYSVAHTLVVVATY